MRDTEDSLEYDGAVRSQILETTVTYKTTKNITKKRILHEQKTIQKTNDCKTKSVTKVIRRYMLQPFFGQDMV